MPADEPDSPSHCWYQSLDVALGTEGQKKDIPPQSNNVRKVVRHEQSPQAPDSVIASYYSLENKFLSGCLSSYSCAILLALEDTKSADLASWGHQVYVL